MSALLIEEQETSINWMRGVERAEIYVSDKLMMAKLDKLVEAEESEWELKKVSWHGKEVVGKFYTCPVNCIHFRPKKLTRKLTEEQKQQFAERMKEFRTV